MLSLPDMALLGAAALMFFGPDQLPRVARKAGLLVREVQMTSQSFVREMERAADEAEERERLHEAGDAYTPPSAVPYVPDAEPHEYPAYDDLGTSEQSIAGERATRAPEAPGEGFHGPLRY